MQQLLDKIGYAFLPETFTKVLPYCFWYWMVFFLIAFYVLRKR
ncbi:hypothetical protein Lederberg_58 [Pelagibacter phage Lederberg EXVC029P]|nr:hypothetical protein Lederberg_58 [Pelagibacter phage Lederberg EXVC029P]